METPDVVINQVPGDNPQVPRDIFLTLRAAVALESDGEVVQATIDPRAGFSEGQMKEACSLVLKQYVGRRVNQELLNQITEDLTSFLALTITPQQFAAYYAATVKPAAPEPKYNVRLLKKHDYVRVYAPGGDCDRTRSKPVLYYRVLRPAAPFDNVMLQHGKGAIWYLENNMLDSDGELWNPSFYPKLPIAWRLRVDFPTAKQLPIWLRVRRWFAQTCDALKTPRPAVDHPHAPGAGRL